MYSMPHQHKKLKFISSFRLLVMTVAISGALLLGASATTILKTNVSAAPHCGAATNPKDPAAVDPKDAKACQVSLTKAQATNAGLDPTVIDSHRIGQTLDVVYTVVGIIAVLMIVIAGIRIITADGDATKVAGARQAIIYAAVGLGVIGSAFVITGLVQGIGTK
jgi:hypothetical protein